MLHCPLPKGSNWNDRYLFCYSEFYLGHVSVVELQTALGLEAVFKTTFSQGFSWILTHFYTGQLRLLNQY